MIRTQVLMLADVRRRASQLARARGSSFGAVVRDALGAYLDRHEKGERDPVEVILLDGAYEDPSPEPALSVDVDYHLYGAPRRSAGASTPPAAKRRRAKTKAQGRRR